VNGTETDIDCGGASCGKCASGSSCSSGQDCQGGVCSGSPKKCQVPSCSDGVKNQTETDVDCGGACGATCAAGQSCLAAGDCQTASCLAGVCQIQATELKVQYRWGDSPNATDNHLKPHLRIVNTGSTSVPLNELKLRYYYTIDSQQPQTASCDFALVGCANVTRVFSSLSPVRPGADTYIELAFSTAAGSIAAGGHSGEIQLRINKNDWSVYNENDDYSFDALKTSLADWNRVTLYRNGVLVWGLEP
jgi:hypothetical protein